VADALYLAFLTGLLLLVALAAALVQPDWAHDLGLDRGDVPVALFAQGEKGCGRDERLEVLDRLLTERQRVVNDLLDGRLTAVEAADAFRRLNDEYGKPAYYDTSAGASEEECLHRHLLRWVWAGLQNRSPQTADYWVAQYEAELRRQRDGAAATH
jgi:hypothetical protein